MRFHVFGAGCYGTFYGTQLLRARAAGTLDVDGIVLVDHGRRPRAAAELGSEAGLSIERAGWDDYLDRLLGTLDPEGDDQLVTPPFTPHLAVRWLLRRVGEERPAWRWRTVPFQAMPGTPFQQQSADGPLLVSHADWICPVHCIEPATCPHTGGPRFWDLDRTVRGFARELAGVGQRVEQVHLFHCHHIAWGVGAYRAATLLEARARILSAVDALAAPAPRPLRFLVGTVSHCHGALHLVVATGGTVPVSDPEALEAGIPDDPLSAESAP